MNKEAARAIMTFEVKDASVLCRSCTIEKGTLSASTSFSDSQSFCLMPATQGREKIQSQVRFTRPKVCEIFTPIKKQKFSFEEAVWRMYKNWYLCRTSTKTKVVSNRRNTWIFGSGHSRPSTEVKEGQPVDYQDEGPLSELAKEISLTKETAPQMALMFPQRRVNSYVILLNVLTNNERQIKSKIFACLYAFLGSKLLSTTTNHPQTNREIER